MIAVLVSLVNSHLPRLPLAGTGLGSITASVIMLQYFHRRSAHFDCLHSSCVRVWLILRTPMMCPRIVGSVSAVRSTGGSCDVSMVCSAATSLGSAAFFPTAIAISVPFPMLKLRFSICFIPQATSLAISSPLNVIACVTSSWGWVSWIGLGMVCIGWVGLSELGWGECEVGRVGVGVGARWGWYCRGWH